MVYLCFNKEVDATGAKMALLLALACKAKLCYTRLLKVAFFERRPFLVEIEMPAVSPSVKILTASDLNRKSILLAECGSTFGAKVQSSLIRHGYEVNATASGFEDLRFIAEKDPDIIILNLDIEGCDELEILRKMRELTDATIIAISAAEDETEEILALEVGADDYIKVPCRTRMLLAHLHANFRRHLRILNNNSAPSRDRTGQIQYANHQLDGSAENGRKVHAFAGIIYDGDGINFRTKDGVAINFTGLELMLLQRLIKNVNAYVSPRDLQKQLYNIRGASNSPRLRMQVSRLRRKLERHSTNGKLIFNSNGRGYMLAADITEIE